MDWEPCSASLPTEIHKEEDGKTHTYVGIQKRTSPKITHPPTIRRRRARRAKNKQKKKEKTRYIERKKKEKRKRKKENRACVRLTGPISSDRRFAPIPAPCATVVRGTPHRTSDDDISVRSGVQWRYLRTSVARLQTEWCSERQRVREKVSAGSIHVEYIGGSGRTVAGGVLEFSESHDLPHPSVEISHHVPKTPPPAARGCDIGEPRLSVRAGRECVSGEHALSQEPRGGGRRIC